MTFQSKFWMTIIDYFGIINRYKLKMKIISACCFLIGGLLFWSCDRNEEISGCTNHLAENHDPRATVDDGSCTFSAETQTIWKDGVAGGWNGNLTTYGFVPYVCIGDMIAEADTSEGGNTPAFLVTDGNGDLDVQFRLINPRTASNYIEGSVHVDIQKPEGSELGVFEVYLHGKIVDNVGNCGEFIRTQKLQFSGMALDTTTTTLTIPFRDFSQLYLGDIGVVFGLSVSGSAPNSELMTINNIRWTRF